MSAIRVAEALGLVVVFRKEERGVGAVNRVLVKQIIHRMQQPFGMVQSDCTLAAQVRLQVCHQKRSGNSFAGNITDHQAKPLFAEIQEIEVVPSHLPGLNTKSCIFEGLRLRTDLWEQPGLHLGCDFQFLRGAAFGLDFLYEGAALIFDTTRQLIEASEPKRVSVHIFKAREYPAPGRNLRWKLKVDSAAAPLFVFRSDIFGDEVNLGVASDKLVYVGIGCRLGESDIRAAVRRPNLDPPPAVLENLVHKQPETELVQVETQTSLLITNEDHDEMQREIGILSVQAGKRAINPKWCRGVTHSRDYIRPRAGSRAILVAGCIAVLKEKLSIGILLLMISIWIRTDNILIVLVVFGWLVWNRKLSTLYAGILATLAIGIVAWINILSGNYGLKVLLHYSFVGGKYPAQITNGISLVEYARTFVVNAEALVPQLAPWLLLGIAAWSLRSRDGKFLVPVVVACATRYLLFPSGEARYFTWAYLLTGILFIRAVVNTGNRVPGWVRLSDIEAREAVGAETAA